MLKFLTMAMICLLPFCVMGGDNYGGHDVLVVSDTLDSATTVYTEPITVNSYHDLAVIVKIRDTNVTGFSDDSINFSYGYECGHTTACDTGTMVTAWFGTTILDTAAVTELGDSFDTTNVGGYAYQIHTLLNRVAGTSPGFMHVIRFWVCSLGRDVSSYQSTRFVDVVFDVKTRHYDGVKIINKP